VMVKDVTLTDEQKTKVAELKKVYDPKFKQAREKLDTILTDEQKKMKQEAKEAGKNPKDLWKILKLTDDQMAKLKEGQKALQTLRKEAREKAMDILTPEQKKQLQKTMIDRMRKGDRGPGDSEGGNGPESK
jgi:Spy/CpxP family protein refolding chaperone